MSQTGQSGHFRRGSALPLFSQKRPNCCITATDSNVVEAQSKKTKSEASNIRSILYFQFHSFQSSVAHFGHAVCHLPPRCWRTRQPNSWAAIHNACNSDRLLIVSSASKRALHTSHTKAVLSPCLSMLIGALGKLPSVRPALLSAWMSRRARLQ